MKESIKPFGYHLTIDLYNCKTEDCDNLDLCYRFLHDIVGFLKMEKQSPPFIFRSDCTKYPDKAGLSGWVSLIESSVVIHTLTPKRFMSIDVYSCRKFDIKDTTDYVKKYFSTKSAEVNFLKRGLKYHATKHL